MRFAACPNRLPLPAIFLVLLSHLIEIFNTVQLNVAQGGSHPLKRGFHQPWTHITTWYVLPAETTVMAVCPSHSFCFIRKQLLEECTWWATSGGLLRTATWALRAYSQRSYNVHVTRSMRACMLSIMIGTVNNDRNLMQNKKLKNHCSMV